jgi:hypothetical protein
MECDKCHRQRNAGRLYSFYYGSKGPTATTFEWGARVRRTPYRIAGQETAWICDRCVNLLYIPAVVVGIFMLGVLLLASLYPEVNAANAVCCGSIGVAFLAISLLSRREWGEWFAIRAKRATLRSQGYDAFFTTLGYRRLEKSS